MGTAKGKLGVLWLAEDSNYGGKVTRIVNWQGRKNVSGQMKSQHWKTSLKPSRVKPGLRR